jgi:hypothetical protein
MADVPSPPRNNAPGEPPAQVTSEVIWRLAARLFADHRRAPTCPRCDDGTGDRCATCRQPWPCAGRRLAELGLNRAVT